MPWIAPITPIHHVKEIILNLTALDYKHNLPGKYVHGTFHDQQLIYSVSWHPPCHNYIERMISSHKARLKKMMILHMKGIPCVC
jgi:hypothetical protein